MGFSRHLADATITRLFISAQDTAILAEVFDVDAVLDAIEPDAAIRDEQLRQLPETATDAEKQRATSRAPADENQRQQLLAAASARVVIDAFFTAFGDGAAKRVQRTALEKVAAAGGLPALVGTCKAQVRAIKHAEYRLSGDEAKLGTIAADVIRWRLRALTAPQEAKAKGRLTEAPAEGVSEFEHYYQVNRWVMSQTLTGAEGWSAFAASKKGLVTDECLDLLPPDWVIEIGSFVLEMPDLQPLEKKA